MMLLSALKDDVATARPGQQATPVMKGYTQLHCDWIQFIFLT